ncbi:MAG: hypothetical protein LBE09_01440 [Christensenellaceae bacterium]|jgi:hypothetical protein|nr:hypothetical protein [Christensenellaceae bacterium]
MRLDLSKSKLLTVFFASVLLAVLCYVSVVSVGNSALAAELTMPEEEYNSFVARFLTFEIDTADYVSGTIVSKTTAPTITIKLTGSEKNATNTLLYYAVKESIGTPTASDWLQATGQFINDGNNVSMSISSLSFVPEQVDIYSTYIYFRTRYVVAEDSYVQYDNPRFINLILDTAIPIDSQITNIVTHYQTSNTWATYDTATLAPWVSTAIRFTITTSDTSTGQLFYCLEDGKEIPIDAQNKQAVINADTLSSDPYYGAYAGPVRFKATDASGNSTYWFTRVLNIKIDTRDPVFSVGARKSNGETYVSNSWSPYDVQYILTSDMQSTKYGAGSQFYYTEKSVTENEWFPLTSLTPTSGQYIATSSKDYLSFKAVSESGKEFYPTMNIWSTRIDKVTPGLVLNAKDGHGFSVKTAGTVPGTDYKSGYASNLISFEATNSATNVSTVTYAYANITDDPDVADPVYVEESTTSPYKKDFLYAEDTPVTKTFIFRAMSAAGLKSEIKFTTTIVPSQYEFAFADPISYEKINGWGNSAITVKFRVQSVIGTDNEFSFSWAPAGSSQPNNINTKLLSSTDGYSIYEGSIAVSINKQVLAFTVTNLSGDKQEIQTNEQIWLDTTPPNATIVRYLTGSNQYIDDDGWANGRVTIYLTPQSGNYSGISCIPLLDGLQTTELTFDGVGYSREVTASGKYVFRLLSGSGLYTDYTVSVNIDQTAIVLEEINAFVDKTVGNEVIESGLGFNTGTSTVLHVVSETVSGNVTLKFKTNQDGHFTVYYQLLSGATPTEGAYITSITDELVVDVSQFKVTGSTGSVQYAFYLESKAVSAAGVRSKTAVHTVRVDYDIKEYTIEVAYAVSQEFVRESVQFVLRSEIEIVEYQYRAISDDGESGILSWETATSDIKIDGVYYTGTFKFEGLDGLKYNNTTLGKAFSGTLEFRGISYANAVSATSAGIVIKVDGSTPDPLNVISFKTTGGTWDSLEQEEGVKKVVYIYTPVGDNNQATLQKPSALVFRNFAPIEYYILNATNVNTPISENAFANAQAIDTTQTISHGAHYLYAKSIYAGATYSQIYKIVYIEEKTTPSVIMYAIGAAKNSAGIYAYNWSDYAMVQLSISNIEGGSGIYVYLIDQAGNRKLLTNSPIKENSGASTITISFDGTGKQEGLDGATYTYPGNFNEIFSFEVVTIGGVLAKFNAEDRVHIKIDVLEPTFNIHARTDSREWIVSTGSSEADYTIDWVSEDIFLRIVPTVVNSDGNYEEVAEGTIINPSGVIYWYKIGAAGDQQQLPGRGTYFSFDDLIMSREDKDRNGVFELIITASVRAGKKSSSTTIIIQIDRIVPEFEINGRVKPEGATNDEIISSGAWTRAKTVTLSTKSIVTANAPLEITYTYYTASNPDQLAKWDNELIVTEISRIYIVATNTAGLTVTHYFDVNIDFTAPVIHSGIIQNNSVWLDGKEIIDRENPFKYYVDQTITYTENNLKSAYYNGFPLINGATIGTNTVDNSNGGFVHIVVEDLAGNVAELVFYMTVFELTVNNITLSAEHRALLNTFIEQFEAAQETGTITDTPRIAYFSSRISELEDRLGTLQSEVTIYQEYLKRIAEETQFTLANDYATMYSYINLFISPDETIRYPEWQQTVIIAEPMYASAYLKLKSEYEKLRIYMAAVELLQSEVRALPAVNVVEKDDYTKILTSYNAYTNLATTQKGVFDTALYTKMMELKRRCEILLLQDDNTGVKISGDNLSPGVRLEVQEFANSTAYVQNAQNSLLELMPTSSARAIIYVKKLMLSDLGAQYNTGEITIELNIPNEYKEFIAFGVYKLTSDGSIIPIDNILINAYGTSVSFTSTSLDTYILAVRAEIKGTSTDENVLNIFDIPIDYTMLTYIAYVAIGLFGVALLVLVLVGIRQRRFVNKYNKKYKNALVRRGLASVPKGNPKPRTNPVDGKTPFDYD